jgi:Ribbon-helix-helix protein, copG family
LASAWLNTRTYGRVYGMEKTTVYIPRKLKSAVERAAAERGCSEAEVIRDALRELTRSVEPPKPRLPLFASGKSGLAKRAEAALKGFGER